MRRGLLYCSNQGSFLYTDKNDSLSIQIKTKGNTSGTQKEDVLDMFRRRQHCLSRGQTVDINRRVVFMICGASVIVSAINYKN